MNAIRGENPGENIRPIDMLLEEHFFFFLKNKIMIVAPFPAFVFDTEEYF